MAVTTHMCRGNFRSSWAADGGYDFVAEALFNELEVDGFFMEWDDERSGGFEPLRFVPTGKQVVLGLVTTKRGELEAKDELKRRIEEALPSHVEEKPHCGERQSCSMATNARLLDAPLRARPCVSSSPRLVVTRPSTTILPLRHEAQRLEAAGALVVVLDEVAVDVELAEERLGDEVVAARGGPGGAEVAAAHVRRDRHAVRPARERRR